MAWCTGGEDSSVSPDLRLTSHPPFAASAANGSSLLARPHVWCPLPAEVLVARRGPCIPQARVVEREGGTAVTAAAETGDMSRRTPR